MKNQVNSYCEPKLTLFAPTNKAFSNLPTFVLRYLKSNPKIAWNEQQYQRSKNAIENQVLGRFLKAKFDNLGHYYPSLLEDKVILKALESIKKR